ncbi:MAG: hypothetical protein M0Z31_00605 [Clostridia bacterium]|nr:hypothetical protein [Clostridia bacterium]
MKKKIFSVLLTLIFLFTSLFNPISALASSDSEDKKVPFNPSLAT